DESAARKRKRLVLVADLGGKSAVDYVGSGRQIGDRFTLGCAPGAIDRLDGADLQIELLGDLFKLRAAAELLVDLLPDLVHLGLGAIARDVSLKFLFDLGE